MRPNQIGLAANSDAGTPSLLADGLTFNTDFAGGGGFPSPETTITGPTLDVTATTNYTADTITDVKGITFATTAASSATFNATQFGSGQIANSATITGDANADTFIVDIANDQSFNGSELLFSNWTSADVFEIKASSNDLTITGTSANDIIKLGAFLDTTDFINGGDGNNTIDLAGDYSANLEISTANVKHVDKFDLAEGNTYNLTFTGGTASSGQTTTIDGAELGASDTMTIDLHNDTSGNYAVEGGAGDNYITLNTQADTIHAGSGTNAIYAYGRMSTSDRIEGAGSTHLYIGSGFSTEYAFKASEITGVDVITLSGGFSYDLKMNDANVAAGASMVIDGDDLGAGDSLTFNAAHETDGDYDIDAGGGLNILTGGSGANTFYFEGPLLNTDRINGGGGDDTLFLDGDYSAGVKFGTSTITNIAEIYMESGHSYTLTMADGNLAAGQTMTVDGGALLATDTLVFNGSKETNGNYEIHGGGGNDIITAGAGNDYIAAGIGADKITAGSGNDTFAYSDASDSTSTTHDTIVGFNAAKDLFQMSSDALIPNAIDTAVTTGELRTADFDTDLATAIGATQLHAHDAVLFTPNSGSLMGHTFLIVDANGTAGYQAGADLVIDITGATNLSQFGLSNFT